ncbi:MAG: hypothetical protein RJA76_1068 [Bacteroidota bacterium]|jgi:predicted DNA-binding transcriptional regulator YafY
MKNFDRLEVLNNCLLKKSFEVNFERFSGYLKEYYDVENYAERTFNRDIRELKNRLMMRFPHLENEYGDLIKYARSGNYYYLVRSDISAFPGFSEKELYQIANSIEQNKHLFTDGLGKGILQKLSAIGLENRLSRYHQDVQWPVLQLIKDGERSGGHWLEPLLEKIYRKQVIVLEHKGLKNTSVKKKIKALPLLIKEYNNGWYTGWYLLFYPILGDQKFIRPQVEELWCFALDRLVGISDVKEEYQIRISENFNPTSYFDHILGIYRSDKNHQKLQDIKIRIPLTSWLINYVEKYPIHKSQVIVQNENDHMILHLRMEINIELENFFRRYQSEMEILEPKNWLNS